MKECLWRVYEEHEINPAYRSPSECVTLIVRESKQADTKQEAHTSLWGHDPISNIGEYILSGLSGTVYYGLSNEGGKKAWKLVVRSKTGSYRSLVERLNQELLK